MATAKAKSKLPETGKYVVLSKLDHDSTIYRKGSIVVLTDVQAEPLIYRRIVEEAK